MHSAGSREVILGGVLVFLSLLLFLFVTGPMRSTAPEEGFGDWWRAQETLAFLFFRCFRGAWAFGLFGPFLVGVCVLTYGGASLGQASFATLIVSEVLALLSSSLLWWGYLRYLLRKIKKNQIPFPITQKTAPPALLLNTPYTLSKLTMIIHAVRRRQSFYPLVPPFAAPGQIQPVTWYLEIACTLKNHARKKAWIWAQLQEVVPDNAESRTPLCLRQSLPLSEDEVADQDFEQRHPPLARYRMEVKDREESKIFFKFDERMQVHTMAFSLYLLRKNQAVSQKLLFTVNV